MEGPKFRTLNFEGSKWKEPKRLNAIDETKSKPLPFFFSSSSFRHLDKHMGENSGSRTRKHGKRRRRTAEDGSDSELSSDSLPFSSSSEDERSKKKRRSSDERHYRKSSSRKDKKSRRDRNHKKIEKELKRSRRRKSDKGKRKRRDYYSDSDESVSESGSDYDRDGDFGKESPEEVVECILKEFPAVAGDLEQVVCLLSNFLIIICISETLW